MGGPAQKAPTEAKEPRLSAEETERRAGRAFDAAMASVIRTNMRPPPPSEISAFRKDIEARLAKGENVNVGSALDAYSRKNPNSAIARYNKLFQGDTSWITSPDGSKIAFQASAFEALCRDYVSASREHVVGALVKLNNPDNRKVPIDMSGMDSAIALALSQQLSAQVKSGSNQLPATVTFEQSDDRILVANLLPPPDQEVKFRKG